MSSCSRTVLRLATGISVLLLTTTPASAGGLHLRSQNTPRSCGAPRVTPGIVEMSFRLSDAVSAEDHSFHFIAAREPYSVTDGHKGSVTALAALLYPGATGGAQDVFFWHNRSFVGLASMRVTTAISGITSPRPGVLVVSFYHYRPTDPLSHPTLPSVRVTYRWNGRRLVAHGRPPTGGIRITWRT